MTERSEGTMGLDLPAAVTDEPGSVLLGLDFDGTLAPIVDDPTRADIHPESLTALRRLGRLLGQVAIITGRPLDQVRRLGRFEDGSGLEHLVICGQYGAERWDASTNEITRPPRPESIVELERRLPGWLAAHAAQAVRIEDKGLALALHTRGVAPGLLDDLAPDLAELASELGLMVEPGRQVIELRTPGTDKGEALAALAAGGSFASVVYIGDDLGDLPAFDAVDTLRAEGLFGLLAVSASTEQQALVPRADLVLDGPDGVAEWLTALADAID
ncbi:trehalose-phosphatase [Aeromicrobium piscarium]|uniref:Trehalose 6-phosphate phosphatase n=1 Tax=Aeromicrobium piscarium TaxID=2590901 RepID=A0A554SPN4_9ACTN|nr:trehalose-phosphatase [Aeromicrobium piscarium]TSD68239.1 trehalose-phosphatase [Aeromicrobium piscarium]